MQRIQVRTPIVSDNTSNILFAALLRQLIYVEAMLVTQRCGNLAHTLMHGIAGTQTDAWHCFLHISQGRFGHRFQKRKSTQQKFSAERLRVLESDFFWQSLQFSSES